MYQLKIRPVRKRDIIQMQQTDTETHSCPWSEREWEILVKQKTTKSLVSECLTRGLWYKKIIGFVTVDIIKDSVDILKLTVRPEWRRQRIATDLFNKAMILIEQERWPFPNESEHLVTHVWAGDEVAEMFLRKNGFKASAFRRNYQNTGNDVVTYSKLQQITKDIP